MKKPLLFNIVACRVLAEFVFIAAFRKIVNLNNINQYGVLQPMDETEDIKAEINDVLRNDKLQLKRWIYFADKLINSYFRQMEIDVKGYDIVYGIFEKLLCGELDRKREEKPVFSDYMYSRIGSAVTNLSKKHHYSRRLFNSGENGKMIPEENLFVCTTNLDVVIENLNLREITRDILIDDEDCGIVFEYLVDGYKDNKSIAEDLGISVNEVSNIKRKIKYKIEKFISNLQGSRITI